MRSDDLRRHSRWMLRTQEWDEPRARYPNVWHEGMPKHVLAFDTVASRMRLGDLIAVYYPASQTHKDRSERFVGISRVAGLRRSHDPAYAWIDLEIAHRFDPPLDVGESPRRVVMCCDPGWPEPDIVMFRKVHDAAVAAGWKPGPEDALDRAPGPSVAEAPSQAPRQAPAGSQAPRIDRAPSDALPVPAPLFHVADQLVRDARPVVEPDQARELAQLLRGRPRRRPEYRSEAPRESLLREQVPEQRPQWSGEQSLDGARPMRLRKQPTV